MKRHSKQVYDFIIEHRAEWSAKELAERCNHALGTALTNTAVRSFLHNHHLQSGRPNGVPAGYSKLYPQEVKDFIFGNMKGVGPREMTQKVNDHFGTAYTVDQMKNFYARNNLNSGVTGYFAPRHIPWNKGLAGYSAPGSEHTRFKKGNLPYQTMPVGAETTTKDGYTRVKVAMPNVWKLKHRLVWEQAHGPIPEGHAVMFKDQNKTNFALDNLMLIERAQLATMNHENLWGESAEVNESYALMAKLKNKIARREKKK